MQESFNQEIQCGGVAVHAGDLVIADGSGVVFIPQSKADMIITEAEGIASREKKMAERILAGESVLEVMEGMKYESMNLPGKEQ